MRRKARARAEAADDERTGADSSARDHDAFWLGAPSGVDGHFETLAGVVDTEEQEMADDTLEYMGTPRTHVDPEELTALAEWAGSKACRVCRKKLHDTHDLTTLKHPNCRSALRVERILRRYT